MGPVFLPLNEVLLGTGKEKGGCWSLGAGLGVGTLRSYVSCQCSKVRWGPPVGGKIYIDILTKHTSRRQLPRALAMVVLSNTEECRSILSICRISGHRGPHPHSMIIGGTCKHLVDPRVPGHTVHDVAVSLQGKQCLGRLSVVDVDLVVCKQRQGRSKGGRRR